MYSFLRALLAACLLICLADHPVAHAAPRKRARAARQRRPREQTIKQTGASVVEAEPAPSVEPEPELPAAESAPAPVLLESTVSERPAESTPVSDGADEGARRIAVEATAGIRALHRDFHYSGVQVDASHPKPFTHRLPLGPVAFAELALYPLAYSQSALLGNVGLVAGFEQLFATKAEFLAHTPEAVRLQTSMQQFQVGLRARLPIREHEVGLRVAYGQQRFDIEDATIRGKQGGLVPNVHYAYAQLALDGRLALGALALSARVGTRIVTDSGPLARDWAVVKGIRNVELGGALAYRVFAQLEIVASGELLVYELALSRAAPNRQVAASSASDLYASGSLGLRWSLPVRVRSR